MSASSDAVPAEAVRQFFDQWNIYRKIVAANYLHHDEAYAAIRQALEAKAEPFSFLDLGSGDASATSGVLPRDRVRSYEAVDISGVALDLARENTAGLGCERRFAQADFFAYLAAREEPCDVIFVGLSVHHLPEEGKRAFLAKAASLSRHLIIYEPIREPGESRDTVLARWWEVARHWSALGPEELRQAKEHVFGYDYPEPIEDYRRWARESGFATIETPFIDRNRLYAVIDCRRCRGARG